MSLKFQVSSYKCLGLLATCILQLATQSCKEKIDLPLNENIGKLVIEASVSDDTSGYNPAYVKLSQSVAFNDSLQSIGVKADSLFIYDSKGNQFQKNTTHWNSQSTVYVFDDLIGEVGQTYYLKVYKDNKIYTAQSTLNPCPKIDSFYTWYLLKAENKVPSIRIKDPVDQKNYYRYYINLKREGRNYLPKYNYVFEDRLINGTTWNFSPNREFYKLNDTVEFNLLSIDQTNYDYWKILLQNQAITAGGNNTAAPSNPTTNIQGGDVLGYFSAHSRKSIKFKIQ